MHEHARTNVNDKRAFNLTRLGARVPSFGRVDAVALGLSAQDVACGTAWLALRPWPALPNAVFAVEEIV